MTKQLEFDFEAKPAAGIPDPTELDETILTDGDEGGRSSTPPDGQNPLRALMDQNFLQYASYVICERAIPNLEDGLKPVQRRILHALWEKDDGRFIKVANVVGHCMQYHPHGDASITDAHDLSVQVESFLRKEIPGLGRVIIHTEPNGP